MAELKKLQEEGPRQEEINGAVEADRRERETAERTNSYWLHWCVYFRGGRVRACSSLILWAVIVSVVFI